MLIKFYVIFGFCNNFAQIYELFVKHVNNIILIYSTIRIIFPNIAISKIYFMFTKFLSIIIIFIIYYPSINIMRLTELYNYIMINIITS